jgi:prolyl-tRNA synthetase
MPSGKALQSATSHDLGQNFAKTFGITFQDKAGKEQHVWQTSWGLSTRSIGGLILMHGDDNGLRLPPKVAPYQVVILPVRPEADAISYAQKVADDLRKTGIRVLVDSRDDETIGYRINKWELKGAPLRIEIGPKEMESQSLTVVRRDNGAKQSVKAGDTAAVMKLLDDIQTQLLEESRKFTESHTHDVKTYDEFKAAMQEGKGFIRTYWAEDSADEDKIKADTTATSRCKPIEQPSESGTCFYTGKPTDQLWLFAQSY